MIKLPSGKIVCLKKNKYPYGGIYNQYNSLFQPNQNYSNTLSNIFGTINYGLKDNYIYNKKRDYSPISTIYDLSGENIIGYDDRTSKEMDSQHDNEVLNKGWTNFSKGWELGTQALFGLGQDLYNNKLSREKARISQQNYRDEPFTYYDNFNNFYNPLNKMYYEEGGLTSLDYLDAIQNNDLDSEEFNDIRNRYYGDMEDITYNNFNNIKENEEDFILDDHEEYNYNNQNNIFTNPDSKINLKLKNNNVNVTSLHPNLIQFSSDLSKVFPGLVITSGNDSGHMKGSRHYDNLAIDIGANSSDKKQYDNFLELIKDPINLAIYKEKYGIEDIISEGDHIHIELKKNKAKYGMIVDNEGYRKSNINNFTPVKYIDSNYIDTNNMSVPAINANGKILYNNTGTHYIPGNGVIEYPIFQNGGIKKPDFTINLEKDMYGNPIVADNIFLNTYEDRSFRSPVNEPDDTNSEIYLGRDAFPDGRYDHRVIAHENYHAQQAKTGNHIINNNFYKRPNDYTSSDLEYNNYFNKIMRNRVDKYNKYKKFIEDNPNFNMNKFYDTDSMFYDKIYNKFVDSKHPYYGIYSDPTTMEGAAQYYEDTGNNYNDNHNTEYDYKNGGLIKLPSGKFVTIKNK